MTDNSFSRSVKGFGVLVTGAGDGMGRATAGVFAQEGAQVAVTDYRLDTAEAVAAELREKGYTAQAWKMDVSNPDEIRQVTTTRSRRPSDGWTW